MNTPKSKLQDESRTALMFVAPALLLLLIFVIAPFVLAIALSFTNQRLVPNLQSPTVFTGLRNYARLLDDTVFVRALLNNAIFALVVVPVQSSLALLMAVFVNQKAPLVRLFRTIYFSPVAITMVVVSVMWVFLYDAAPEGTINRIVGVLSFGAIGPQQWLQNPALAMPAVILLSIWQGVGFQMVIFLAGLQEISPELYEAAGLDGANTVNQFLNITIPGLRNTIIFVVISTTIFAFQLFTQVHLMTQGGPQDRTQTVVYQIFSNGYQLGRIGYASAISVVFFVIVLLISLVQRIFLREERAIER
jgi:multiple sugar transport system permease protein